MAAVGPLLARGGRRLCEPRAAGRTLMLNSIESVSHGVPAALTELATLGRTLKKRAADVLAYFDRPVGGSATGDAARLRCRVAPVRRRAARRSACGTIRRG